MLRIVDGLLVAVGLVLFWAGPHHLTGDAGRRVDALSQWAATGTPSADRYSMIGPAAALPFVASAPDAATARWWCERTNVLVAGVGLLALAAVLRPSAPAGVLGPFLLLVLYGSMLPHHLQDFTGETFSAFAVGVGLACMGGRWGALGWLLAAVGAANTPAAGPAFALVALVEVVRRRELRYLAAPAVAVALVLAENWWRRGGLFATGYVDDHGFANGLPFSGRPGFSYPFLLGLASILFSAGKGLVFFAPGLFAPATADLAVAPAAEALRRWRWYVAGLVLVYASWWSWYGGWYWGPRFFLVAMLP
ncbi:MAG: hypothetical protein ACRDD1_16840, partial [Planctomycetia bacterium]